MSIIDVKLNNTDEFGWDLVIGSNGDLLIDESFDTPIVVSLFTDTRVDETEIPRPELRRGFWAYDNIGSKIWLLQRRTTENLNKCTDFVIKSLQWLVDDGFLKSTEADVDFSDNGFLITIRLVRFDNRIETLYYEAWENSEFK